MKLLLDQGLPRSTVAYLGQSGLEAFHVGDEGRAEAHDATILDRARERGAIVVTLDADFHARLALSGAAPCKSSSGQHDSTPRHRAPEALAIFARAKSISKRQSST